MQLEETIEPFRKINFEIRAYNDGLAFRYHFPEQEGIQKLAISKENTSFRFADDYLVWAANYKKHKSHQESEFVGKNISQINENEILGIPLLGKVADSCWFAVTESNLRNWAGLYLKTDPDAANTLVSSLSPSITDPSVAVTSEIPAWSPWRVILAAKHPGKMIESNLILNLADPCELEDVSWIQPGISVWDQWWAGAYAPDAGFEVGMNTETIKYYADFANRMGFEYILLDFMWYGLPYIDSVSWRPSTTADITTSCDEVDMEEILKYTSERDLKIILWLHWVHAEKQMEKAFPIYEKWGIGGLKVDMMARDDQFMVNWYEKLLKKAAEHKLVVNFHGAYKPTGLRRTYPNLLTREGVLGNEFNKTTYRITPQNNVTIPFTRMLAGPMDFTPGGFRHKMQKDFKIQPGEGRWQKTPPYVMGTRCHQLAMMVVYESPLQILCDSPYNYKDQIGTDFLKQVPTVWDETVFLEGYPGEYIVLARRKEDTWYLGGMTNSKDRMIKLDCQFMEKQSYLLQLWKDKEDSHLKPENAVFETRLYQTENDLEIKMNPEGGFAAILKPVENE